MPLRKFQRPETTYPPSVNLAVPPALAEPEPRTTGGSPNISVAAFGERRATADDTAAPLNTHHPAEPSACAISSTT